jgi:hypothetical protein
MNDTVEDIKGGNQIIQPVARWKPYRYQDGEWIQIMDDTIEGDEISSINVGTWSIWGSYDISYRFGDRINGVLETLRLLRGIICLQDVSQAQLQRILENEWIQQQWVSGIDSAHVPGIMIFSNVPLLSIEVYDFPVRGSFQKLITATTVIKGERIRVATSNFSKENSLLELGFAQEVVRTYVPESQFPDFEPEPVHYAFVAGNTKLSLQEPDFSGKVFFDVWTIVNPHKPGYTLEYPSVDKDDNARPDRIYYLSQFTQAVWAHVFGDIKTPYNPLDPTLEGKILTPSNHYGVIASFVPNEVIENERKLKRALRRFTVPSQTRVALAGEIRARKVAERLSYSYESTALPGQRINIIVGLRSNANMPFYDISGIQIAPETPSLPAYDPQKNVFGLGEFGIIPDLYPCKTWSDVVNVIYNEWKVSSPYNEEKTIAGAVVAQLSSSEEETVRQQLASLFGIKEEDALDSADTGFVVARLLKEISTIKLNDSQQIQLKQLLESDLTKLNDETAQYKDLQLDKTVKKTLSFFNQNGTHYVSEITIGDAIYQVFVYERDNFEKVQQGQHQWSGTVALGFRYFTSNNYTKYHTKMHIFSHDPAFEAIRDNSKDETFGIPESIFEMTRNNFTQLQKLTKLTPVGMQIDNIANLHSPISETQESVTVRDIQPLTVHDLVPDELSDTQEINELPTDNLSPFLDLVSTESLLTKYGTSIKPLLPDTERSVYAELWKPFTPDTVSFALTKYVSLQQMYIHLDDLWKQRLVNRDIVDTLVLIADVVELGDNVVDLSMIPHVIIVCRLLIANSGGNTTPVIKLSETTFDEKYLYIGQMEGTASFVSIHNRRTVFGGVALRPVKPKDGDNTPGTVEYETYFRDTFPTEILAAETWASDVILNGLEFMLEAIRISLTNLSQALKPTAQAAWQSLEWIVNSTRIASKGKNETSLNFHRIRTQALMVSRSVENPGSDKEVIPSVPGLNYQVYQPAINSLLSLVDEYQKEQDRVSQLIYRQKSEQQQFRTEQEINNNIKSVAQFLLDQNKALTDKERDMTKIVYNNIDEHKKTEKTRAQQQADDLYKQVTDQLDVVKNKQDSLTKAIEGRIAREVIFNVINLGLGIAGMFSGAQSYQYLSKLSDAGKITDWFQEMENMLKKLDNFIKMVQLISNLIQTQLDTVDKYRTLGNTLTDLPRASLDDFPTALEWKFFENGVLSIISPVQSLVPAEASEFLQAARDLAAAGQAYVSAQSTVSRLNYELLENGWRKQVSENQEKRLLALQNKLKTTDLTPGQDYPVDLLHFGSILQTKTNRVLLNLVKTVGLQDASLSYYYIQKPTTVTRFDIISIKETMVQQQQRIINTLTNWPVHPTDIRQPIHYTIPNVLLSYLENPQGHTHEVMLDAPEFINYVRVRVDEIDCRIDNVQTDTGKIHVQLLAQADLFYDRGLRRETLTFKALPQTIDIVYSLDTGETIINTSKPSEEFRNKWIKMTPFQRWTIALPKTSENKGLRFTDNVKGLQHMKTTGITLSFKVNAMYSPEKAVIRAMVRPVEFFLRKAAAPPVVAPDNIQALKGRSVTNGWDAVVAMSARRITELWAERYEEEAKAAFEGDRTFAQEIDTTNTPYEQTTTDPKTYPQVRVTYALKIKVGPPKLNFVYRQNGQAACEVPIINGSLVLTTKIYNSKDDKGTALGAPNTIDLQSKPDKPVFITGAFALEKAVGEVNNDQVQIDSSKGAFGFFGSGVTLDPVTDSNAATALSTWFKNNKLNPWILGSLIRNADQNYLKPRFFNFSTLFPPPGDDKHEQLLLMFVQTTGAPSTLQVSMPTGVWPISQDYDATIFLNSKLIFDNLVKPAISAKLSCYLDHNQLDSYLIRGTGNLNAGTLRACDGGFFGIGEICKTTTINVPLDGMSVTPNMNSLDFNFSKTWSQSFPYTYVPFGARKLSVTTGSTDMTVTGSQPMIPSLNADTAEISFPSLNPTFNVSFKKSSTLEKIFGGGWSKDSAAEEVTGKIRSKLDGIKFNMNSVSAWAVANLLFPASKTIDLKGVFFSGDLVLIGNVSRKWINPQKK